MGTTTLSIAGAGEDSAATGDLDLRVNVTIQGTLGSSIVAGGTGFGDRIFDIPSGLSVNVTLKALTVQGGTAFGSENGGGVRNRSAGLLSLVQADFTNNTSARGSGGGLSQTAGTLFATTINFTGNSAGSNGGGADLEGSVVTTMATHLTFTSNTALQGGGLAAFVAAGATGSMPMLNSSTFSGNATTSGGYGGGLAIARTTAVQIDVLGNTASNGGGVELVGSTVPSVLSGRIVIRDNTASINGGGIYSKNCGSCSLLHVVLENNEATKDGSALYPFGGLTIEKTTMNANHTGGLGRYGGAVLHTGTAAGGPLILTNLTIGENTSSPVGGAVVVTSKATDLFSNVTIGNNTGGTANGIAVPAPGKPPQLRNTVVSSAGTNCSRPLLSLGHNLESGNTCGFNKTGDLINADPLLFPLADNGGGTHTMKPQGTSPVMDAGDTAVCPIYDQRSARRPYDWDGNGTATCDIGAYEQGGLMAALNSDVGFSSITVSVSGSIVTYTLGLKNVGAGSGLNTMMADNLPASLSFVSCTVTVPGACGGIGNNRTVKFDEVKVGDTPTITIVANILGTGTIVNSVSVWSDNADWFPTDNTGSATIQV